MILKEPGDLLKVLQRAELICRRYGFYVLYWVPGSPLLQKIYLDYDEVKYSAKEIDWKFSTFDVFSDRMRSKMLFEIDICLHICDNYEEFLTKLEARLIEKVLT